MEAVLTEILKISSKVSEVEEEAGTTAVVGIAADITAEEVIVVVGDIGDDVGDDGLEGILVGGEIGGHNIPCTTTDTVVPIELKKATKDVSFYKVKKPVVVAFNLI